MTNYTDLKRRLRNAHPGAPGLLVEEAADAIEALERERDFLAKANMSITNKKIDAENEVERLRGLLREAGVYVKAYVPPMVTTHPQKEALLSRIDAALGGAP